MALNLTPGSNYLLTITVNNTSTANGIPVAVALRLTVAAIVGTMPLMTPINQDIPFTAGQTKTLQFQMNVPTTLDSLNGVIVASILDPTGVQLATASVDVLLVSTNVGILHVVATVMNESTPIPGVKIEITSIVGGGGLWYTGDDGIVDISLPAGVVYDITASKEGYQTQTTSAQCDVPGDEPHTLSQRRKK